LGRALARVGRVLLALDVSPSASRRNARASTALKVRIGASFATAEVAMVVIGAALGSVLTAVVGPVALPRLRRSSASAST